MTEWVIKNNNLPFYILTLYDSLRDPVWQSHSYFRRVLFLSYFVFSSYYQVMFVLFIASLMDWNTTSYIVNHVGCFSAIN